MDWRGAERCFLGYGNVLYIDEGMYIIVCSWQTHWKLKICVFHCMHILP